MNADDGSKGREKKNEVELSTSFSVEELMVKKFGGGSVRFVNRWIFLATFSTNFPSLMPSSHHYFANSKGLLLRMRLACSTVHYRSDVESSYQRAGGGPRKLHFWDFLGISSEYLVSKRRAKTVHVSKRRTK
jgi:hypothetical protein